MITSKLLFRKWFGALRQQAITEPMLTAIYVLRRIQTINRQLMNLVLNCGTAPVKYRQISNIRRTKCLTLSVSSLVLELSLPNLLKSGIKSGMKM